MCPVGGGARVSVFGTRPRRSYASGDASQQRPIRGPGNAISGSGPSSAASEVIARGPQTIFDPAVR